MTENTSPSVERPFSVTEPWMGRLWIFWLAVPFPAGAALFFILPLALPEMTRAAAALALGFAVSLLLVSSRKRAHLKRHQAEAEFLGFTWRLRGSLWNPFSAPELLLYKPQGDPEEDRLLALLVRIAGPDYAQLPLPLNRVSSPALACAVASAILLPRAPQAEGFLYPLIGLSALVFIVSRAEEWLSKFELRWTYPEVICTTSQEAGYRQWNFLSLEGKRRHKGRIPPMAARIREVLLGPAALGPGSKVLEAGCAGGFLWKHIPPELRPGWTGAEKDPAAVLYAKRHHNWESVVRTDLGKLPFPDSSFDAVVGLECFDSLSPADLAAFLPEAMRVLKPGGRLVHFKDFPDWPGPLLAERLNAISMRAVRTELVRYSRLELKFAPLNEPGALGTAALRETPEDRPYARTLARIYAAGHKSDRRYRTPMFVSAMALLETFSEAGFEPVSDSLGAGVPPGPLLHLAVRKPD